MTKKNGCVVLAVGAIILIGTQANGFATIHEQKRIEIINKKETK